MGRLGFAVDYDLTTNGTLNDLPLQMGFLLVKLFYKVNYIIVLFGEELWRIAKLNYKCPCCGYYTFEHPPMGKFNNCPVCCWLDDTQCLNDLDYVSAGLGISLRQARKNFLIKRACKDEFVSEARLPMETELDGINWIIPSNSELG